VSVPFWIHLSLVDECRPAPFRLFLFEANLSRALTGEKRRIVEVN